MSRPEKPTLTIRDRFAGSIIGSACGDALGHKVEFSSLDAIRAKYGPEGIQHFPGAVGQITDDTQMSLAVINGFRDLPDLPTFNVPDPIEVSATASQLILNSGGFVSRRFVEWMDKPMGGHRAPGGACMSGCRAMKAGQHWTTAGGKDAGGCGAIMRSGPYGLMFSLIGDAFDAAAFAASAAAAHAKMTHGHPMGFAAAAAHAAGVAMGAAGATIEQTVGAMLGVAFDFDSAPGGTAERLNSMLRRFDGRLDPTIFLEFPAWRGDDALTSAVHILLVHGDNLLDAIRAAVNIDGDSDSLGAIVGSLVGARTGAADVMTEVWFDRLEFKDVIAKAVDDALLVAETLSGTTTTKGA